MLLFLYVLSGLFFVSFLIMGWMSGSIFILVRDIIFGLTGGGILIALAYIISGQDWIMSQMYKLEESNVKKGYITCPECEKKYEAERNSCPYCAYRPKGR
ncbi:hypothetical protein [Gracilibacillus ureilyticus]|uniref:hypothetical protein n=1 Tax=Gracilibacillus ureilyticus TaxID=531814 RepID=UPI00111334A8|nr:hypothetical protein [Gracilibacillus ureilyticus]